MGLLFVTEFIGWEPPGGRRLGWSLYISDSHIEMGICASKFFVFCVFYSAFSRRVLRGVWSGFQGIGEDCIYGLGFEKGIGLVFLDGL